MKTDIDKEVEFQRYIQDADSYIDGLVQDCSNSSALAMELLQSCTKPSISVSVLIQIDGNSFK